MACFHKSGRYPHANRSIVDITQADNPIILGELRLFSRDISDVAVDANLQIAALTTDDGVILVDVADPLMPTLRDVVELDATQVEVFDGIAYVTPFRSLVAIDLFTGEVLQTLSLNGFGSASGLAREGTTLYLQDATRFYVVDIADQQAPIILSETSVPRGLGLFAANGVAYLGGRGLLTFDVSDPANPTAIGTPESFFISREIALNGSGLAAIASENLGLGIYDVSNPASTNEFLFGFDTTGSADDVEIASGIAFVAGSGLEVINYLSLDSLGIAPTIELETDRTQVLEGSTFVVRAQVTDDVQVRNVELLINGEVVLNEVSFPFELIATAPRITLGSDSFTVQARAIDTGGNITLSTPITLQLLDDVTPPELISSETPDGTVARGGPTTIQLEFSEPLEALSVNPTTVQLIDEEGNMVVPSNFQLRNDDQIWKRNGSP